MGCPHTGFKKGAWVFIRFKDGRRLKAKWLPKPKRGGMIATSEGEFKLRHISSIGHWRNPCH